jgi:hypothetical protein
MSGGRGRVFLLGAVGLLVGYYYLWQARAAGPFEWRGDKNAYYDQLARGFLSGHLYVPTQPSPALLALPDPWDPHVPAELRWQDMVLYQGRYYLYFGATPAAILFVPWRIVTGNDLPEPFAVALLCFAGFLFSAGALLRLLDLAQARPPAWLLALLFLALGVCQSAPFLLNRASVYEVAIASGYGCVAGGLFFLTRGIGPDGRAWSLAASGLMFGLAVGSRPHLVLAGAVALAALALYRRRAAIPFLAAWAAVGLVIAVYNYQRFGNPLEFGFHYQLAGPGQNRLDLSLRNWKPGAYYMLLDSPLFEPVFPWMRMVFRFPFDSAERHPLPPDYFVEPSVGALWTAPFLIAAFAVAARRAKHSREIRLVLGVALASSVAVLLFLISTHLSSQRYEVDFVPLLVFAAIGALALATRRTVRIFAALAIAWSALANLALAIAGPYHDYLHNRPASYLKLARRFSPVPEHRPSMSPRIDLQLEATFPDGGYHEPIVTIGHSHYCYFLYAEWSSAGIRLISKTNDSQLTYDLPHPTPANLPIHLVYTPETGEMRVLVAGREAMAHHVGALVAAPSQVAVGENYADMGLTSRRFSGTLRVVSKTVEERRR